MKRYFVIIIGSLLISETILAQFTDGNLFVYGGTISGPVKKVTVILNQENAPSHASKNVAWFDSLSRITKTAHYTIEKKSTKDELVTDYTYQYVNDTCFCYEHNEKKHIDELFKKICFDSSGKKNMAFYYYKDNLTNVDSFVYKKGFLSEYYSSEYKERIPQLRIINTYDSLGRLIKSHNVKEQSGYEITYRPSGNYTKRHYGNNKHEEKYVVNSKGQVVKEISDDNEIIYFHYDRYGNWQKRVCTTDTHSFIGTVVQTTIRKIEYYE